MKSQKALRAFGTELLSQSDKRKRAPEPKAVPVENWAWTPHDPKAVDAAQGEWPGHPHAIEATYRPSRTQQKAVLVFQSGWLTAGLLNALEEALLPYFYVDFDQFAGHGTVELRVDIGSPQRLTLGDAVLDLRDVAAVFWSPPAHMFHEPAPDATNAMSLYVLRWQQLLRDLRGLIREDAIWIPSHPLNGSPHWQNKLAECAIAQRLGLAVPETLCTTDPDTALAFIRRWPRKVMFREFSHAASLFPAFHFINPKTTRKDLESLESAPGVFQRYIEKEFEVRAVLVGDDVFACRIDSQASAAASLDWRVYDNANVRWDRIKLPARVQSALLKLGAVLDLKMASIDLIKGKDGKYYFLEINRPGATHWLASFVGLDVPLEVVHYLKRALPLLKRRRS